MPCEIHHLTSTDFSRITSRLAARAETDPSVESRVRDIIADVAARGDEALVEYTRRFDCPDFQPSQLRVSTADLERALAETPAEDLDIIRESAGNVRRYHEAQLERSWFEHQPDGTILGQKVTPVDRAGLYVPGGAGGETPLISSLIMNAVPAQVAGVPSLCAASPPRADGTLNPYILATAALLGIEEVVAAGSAWAIAALALGTPSVPAVDVITGPGNIYVTEAKRLLQGRVGIDMLAGPSEIAILADDSAEPSWLAADMLSQAEHDPVAAAICVTTSDALASTLVRELEKQLETLPRKDIAATSLRDCGMIVVVENIEAGCDLVNAIAPEHLELAVTDPWSLVGRIRHAGAMFLGTNCPEPVGDYFAGPNHVLPTMGTARYSSPLSVSTFQKRTSIIATSCEYMHRHAGAIARLARLEGLEAHARSAEIRKKPLS